MSSIEYEYTASRETPSAPMVPAIEVSWDEVERVLGHPHQGSPEDDARLTEALLAAGAPSWVDAPATEGWVDEHGWGLIWPIPQGIRGDQIMLAIPDGPQDGPLSGHGPIYVVPSYDATHLHAAHITVDDQGGPIGVILEPEARQHGPWTEEDEARLRKHVRALAWRVVSLTCGVADRVVITWDPDRDQVAVEVLTRDDEEG